MNSGKKPPTIAGTADSDSTEPPVNLARLNAVVDGDVEFLRELVTIFVASGAQQLSDLNAAVSAKDRTAIARTAHKLKGGCGNIHAHVMYSLAHELETSAVSADAARLAELCQQLTIEFEHAKQFLNDPSVLPPDIKAVS